MDRVKSSQLKLINHTNIDPGYTIGNTWSGCRAHAKCHHLPRMSVNCRYQYSTYSLSFTFQFSTIRWHIPSAVFAPHVIHEQSNQAEMLFVEGFKLVQALMHATLNDRRLKSTTWASATFKVSATCERTRNATEAWAVNQVVSFYLLAPHPHSMCFRCCPREECLDSELFFCFMQHLVYHQSLVATGESSIYLQMSCITEAGGQWIRSLTIYQDAVGKNTNDKSRPIIQLTCIVYRTVCLMKILFRCRCCASIIWFLPNCGIDSDNCPE